MFRTQFDRVRVFTKPGNRFRDTYHAVVTDNGAIELEKDGIDDVYALIQSHKDSVDVNKLLQRYASGDVSALMQRPGSYGDFTSFPKTYAEVLQAVIDAENMFMDLPVDVREKFGHDSNKFIAQIGTPEWMNALGLSTSLEKPVEKPVVKEGEPVE